MSRRRTQSHPVAETGADAATTAAAAPLLHVKDLHVEFPTPEGVVRAVNGISYTLGGGETLAILGESGSGKTVSAQAVMGMLDTARTTVRASAIRLRALDLLALPLPERRRLCGERIGMVFQDALAALNPVFPVGFQIAEMFRIHRGTSRAVAKRHAIELMQRVGIPAAKDRVDDYPHEFSGGMRQRVVIAMAIALEPEVLIADEPTTALDVTIQAQVMELLADLRSERRMGLILITHDIAVVADIADRIAVMYAGKIVETGSVYDVYANPAHPYTEGLMKSVLRIDQGGPLSPIPGTPPNMLRVPPGCPFHPRCDYARERCTRDEPPLYPVSAGRASACHFFDEVLAST